MKPTDLFQKYYQKTASPDEIQKMETWLNADEKNRELFKQYELIWKHSANSSVLNNINILNDWHLINRKFEKQKTLKLNYYIKIAASILLFAISGLLIKKYVADKIYFKTDKYVSKIPTPLIFPDSSIVYTNGPSYVSFIKHFKNKERSISFNGLGYFKIKTDPRNPFRIHSNNSDIIVLGTSFVLETSENTTRIIVEKGIVELKPKNNQINSIKLTEGKIGNYKNGSITVTKNKDPNYLAWHTHKLIFSETGLKQVFRDIKKVYNIELETSLHDPDSIRFTGTFNNKTIEEVIATLEFTCSVEIKIKSCEDEHLNINDN